MFSLLLLLLLLLCKINPFHLRKNGRDFLLWGSHLHIAMKVSFFVFAHLLVTFVWATFRCFFWVKILNKKTLHTFYNLFNTRKMVQIICCFQCPSAVAENGKSHLCFIACADLFFSFSISKGKFYTSIYYFLVASGNKSFFLKCPCGRFRLK